MSRKIIMHPAADISPTLEGERLEAFIAIAKRYGVECLEPMVAVEYPEANGSVNGTRALLSGRMTLAACQALGIDPFKHLRIYKGSESVAELAAAASVLRPQLSTEQLLAAGVEIEDHFREESKIRRLENLRQRENPNKVFKKTPENGDSSEMARSGTNSGSVDTLTNEPREKAARLVGVCSKLITRARQIREQNPDIFAEMKRGTIKFSRAWGAVRDAQKRVRLASQTRLTGCQTGAPQYIITGDALAILPTLPRRKYRLVLVDPPYNNGTDYGDGAAADRLPEERYCDWCWKWITEAAELLTPDGSMWVVIDDNYAAEVVIRLKRAGLTRRAWIKWYETFGQAIRDNFGRTSRHILYFVKNPGAYVFNGEVFTRPSDRQTKYNDARANPQGKIWDDVWQIPRIVGTSTERMPDFPTQLPLALVTPIVAGVTEEGDEVLDFFSGSGTTAVACKMTGRRFTGVEKNKRAAEMARERLARTAGK